jgi:hypothetical protein
VIIVLAMARLGLIKVSLRYNKLVLNVVVMEKQLVRLAKNAKVMGKFKVMKMFQLKFQKVLMMELE